MPRSHTSFQNARMTTCRVSLVLSLLAITSLRNTAGIMTPGSAAPDIEWKDQENCGELESGRGSWRVEVSLGDRTLCSGLLVAPSLVLVSLRGCSEAEEAGRLLTEAINNETVEGGGEDRKADRESTLTAKFLSAKLSSDVERVRSISLAEIEEPMFLLSLGGDLPPEDQVRPVCLLGGLEEEENGLENATSICNRADGTSQESADPCLGRGDCPFITLEMPSQTDDGKIHLWGIYKGDCVDGGAVATTTMPGDREEGDIIKVTRELRKKIILERLQKVEEEEEAKSGVCPQVTVCQGKYTCVRATSQLPPSRLRFPANDNFSSVKCPIFHLCPKTSNQTAEGTESQFLASNETTGLTNELRTLEELESLCQSGNYDEYSSAPLSLDSLQEQGEEEEGASAAASKSSLGALPNGSNLGERNGLVFSPEREVVDGEENNHTAKSLFPQCAGSNSKRCESIPNGSCLVLNKGGFLAISSEAERCRCVEGFDYVVGNGTKGSAGRCVAGKEEKEAESATPNPATTKLPSGDGDVPLTPNAEDPITDPTNSSVPKKRSAVQTCPTVEGVDCEFPFLYEDQLRFECVKLPGRSRRKAFCPTRIDRDGKPVGNFGECSASCPLMRYHDHFDLMDDLANLAELHPMNTEQFEIGKSNKGKPLVGIRISKDVGGPKRASRQAFGNDLPLAMRPKVKLIGNMHGNEPTGRELLIHFARYLLEGEKLQVPRAVDILGSIDLYILPTMNPDGFERGTEGRCSGGSYSAGRLNEGYKDLNRDFPTWWDWRKTLVNASHDIFAGRQTETKLLMEWTLSDYFTLSINFHDGAVLVNYPWDNYHNTKQVDGVHETPDHDEFLHLATTYSSEHTTMHNTSAICPQWGFFQDGITNGADWYPVRGGMQDFNYLFAGTMEVLVEVSCCKYPGRHKLLREWDYNRESLFAFVRQANRGARGVVRDRNGQHVQDAKVWIKTFEEEEFRKFPVRSNENGIYFRVLTETGNYTIQAFTETESVRENNIIERKKDRLSDPIDFFYDADLPGYVLVDLLLTENPDTEPAPIPETVADPPRVTARPRFTPRPRPRPTTTTQPQRNQGRRRQGPLTNQPQGRRQDKDLDDQGGDLDNAFVQQAVRGIKKVVKVPRSSTTSTTTETPIGDLNDQRKRQVNSFAPSRSLLGPHINPGGQRVTFSQG